MCAAPVAEADEVVAGQVEFFRKNRAGCPFAAYAARDPSRFGWHHAVLAPTADAIDAEIAKAVAETSVSTLSLIFPGVATPDELLRFLKVLESCALVHLGQDTEFEQFRCLGFRARVGHLESWISGFGPFDFLPKTRRAPATELVTRVKPRPNYEKIMKEAPEGVIHLADMDMLGIPPSKFEMLWEAAHTHTARIVGHRPDLKSAAKTTFAIPFALFC